jgi:hypothetical protein
MSNTTSGQDYLFLPNLTVITMSLANMGMYFEESVMNLLVPALLSAFWKVQQSQFVSSMTHTEQFTKRVTTLEVLLLKAMSKYVPGCLL